MSKLFYLTGKYYRMTSIPVSILDESGKVFLYEMGYINEANPLRYGDIILRIADKAKTKNIPFIISEEGICAYGVMKDTSSCLIVFGPVELRKLTKSDVSMYAQSRGIPKDNFGIVSRSTIELLATLETLYYIYYDVEIPENQFFESEKDSNIPFLKKNDIIDYVMQNTEDEFSRLSYDVEVDFLSKIRAGDVDALNTSFKRQDAIELTGSINHVGRMADKPSKHFEYLVCSSITLASRAAIEGGVEPDAAYILTDLYMQRLERCGESVIDILALHVEMKTEFARQVKSVKERRGRVSYIEKCKTFIVSHLNKPFSLEELSDALNINKQYISRKFKEETGMSIMEYAREQRIEAAAGMLKYSNKSITAIATFLCFASQSHLGALFKKIKGVTPQQYRNEKQIIFGKAEN